MCQLQPPSRSTTGPPHRQRAGLALIYLAIFMTALVGFLALSVDVGRLHLSKLQLQTAADGAARAAVWQVPGNLAKAQANATAVAAANTCLGTSISLVPSQDVQFGRWDVASRTFSVLTGSAVSQANATQVATHRLAARGTAVPTVFAAILGINSSDVSATAIAYIHGGQLIAGGIVGITLLNMSGTPTIDSYNSDAGPYNPSNPGRNAVVASNSDITGTGHPTIDGDATPGPGHTVSPSINVTGSTTPLTQPLVFPPVDASSYRNVNDNAKIKSALDAQNNISLKGNGSLHVPAGTYYIHDLSMAANATLYIDGAAIFYVTGSISVAGTVDTVANKPANFQIMVEGAGTVDLRGNSDLYAAIYAPLAGITLRGTHDYYGTMIGNTLSMVGTSAIHVDESLVKRGPFQVALVK